jgi:3-hydroxyisobutyrate dehydrogenase-like beta-hydroxyacid dehydrogenase
VTVGFIGFGEAGSTIASGLRAAGVERIVAFDIAAHDPRLGPTIQERARRSGATIVASPADVIARMTSVDECSACDTH